MAAPATIKAEREIMFYEFLEIFAILAAIDGICWYLLEKLIKYLEGK